MEKDQNLQDKNIHSKNSSEKPLTVTKITKDTTISLT